MKLPFDIKYRPQIESGEYKLETECGHPVSIMDWEWIDRNEEKCLAVKVLMDEGYNIGYLFNYDGKRYSIFPTDSDSDLFIITPEPEFTDWETFISGCLQKHGLLDCGAADRIAKECSAELLSLAMDARAEELSEGLIQSKLDGDSIPYHLIEFMCNLYTCRNWKEIEETAELYATRFKAAALKDLPRWSPNDIYPELNDVVIGSIGTDEHFFIHKGRIIHLESLETLPGFKED